MQQQSRGIGNSLSFPANAGLAVGAIILSLCWSALAQQSGPKALTIVGDWKGAGLGAARDYAAVSSDGLLVAHPMNGGLYITDTETGKDRLITNAPGGGHVAFSPDGTHLAFDIGSTMSPFTSVVYTERVDGSDLFQASPSDPSGATECKVNPAANTEPREYAAKVKRGQLSEAPECSVQYPLYSPDGSKMMVQVLTNPGKRDEKGFLREEYNQSYIGLISSDAIKQEPVRQASSGGQFWSSNGEAIYHSGLNQPGYLKYDLSTRQSVSASGLKDLFILGAIPGSNDFFAIPSSWRRNAILAITPEGLRANISGPLAHAVMSTPLQDTEGRTLTQIQMAAKAHRFLLLYYGDVGGGSQPWGENNLHVQLVEYQ